MMSIQNSQKLINDYNYLIGQDYDGVTIETLIITPRNDPEFSEAIRQYIQTNDSSLIYPASNINGYTVTAILDAPGILIHLKIFDIFESKEIEIDFSHYGIEF